MSNFFKQYGSTEGPLGLPMTDGQAKVLEGMLKGVPPEDREIARVVVTKQPVELLEGSRQDVSYISTEAIDREGEVVVARGMDDSHFAINPLVTMQHSYWAPPVGKSLWRKRVKDGNLIGIKAKTHYPARPTEWVAEEWNPDIAFTLIKAGLMNGKSVGFLRLKSHEPTPEEIKKNPDLADARRIIDEWLLLEYACCFIPMNQESLVEQVSKSGIAVPHAWLPELANVKKTPQTIPFTSVDEIERAIKSHISKACPGDLIENVTKNAYHKLQGRV